MGGFARALAVAGGIAVIAGCGSHDGSKPARAAVATPTATPTPERSCTGHSTVTVTHAAPRPALYEMLPMFRHPDRRWTLQRARELLDIRRGPALIGVHVDHVRDLGTHSGVHFQAVPVAEPILGGPAECAPEYDPTAADPVPGVCVAWWPDRRTPNRRARDCPAFLREGSAFSAIPLGGGRDLAYWLLPAGRRAPTVIPTGVERRRDRRPVRFRRAEGQLYLAVTTHWPTASHDYSFVRDGKVVRRRGPYHRN
jgi:hypothetical protein